jgi:hypothetical protein
LLESAENPVPQSQSNKYVCEDATFGGRVCGMPAYYLASYGGGDSTPLCLPHIMLELEATRLDNDVQQQEWVITCT